MENYEEKYKAALGWMQNLYDGLHGKTREEAERYFPELQESEDEKIRNWLIGYFHQYKEDGMEKYANGLKVESIIAWLEKQGEQKSSWSKEDEQYLLVCKNALAKYQTTDKWDANIIYNWLKNKLQKL